MKNIKYYIFLQCLFYTYQVFGNTCPTSPMKIEPKLKAVVSYDKTSKFYTYNYSLENESSAKLPIYLFRIIVSEPPEDIKTPSKWRGRYENFIRDDDFPKNIMWAESTYAKPGEKAEGFSFKSLRPPGLVKYYAIAKPGIPTVTPTADNDEPEPDCPGFFYDRPVLDGYVNGITQGPEPVNQQSVEIKLKRIKNSKNKSHENEDTDLDQISPYKETGKIAVILKGNKDLDLKTINLSTVTLGTGKAPVLESSFKNEKQHNELRMVFDLAAVQIECGRDRVLFFSGKTTSGKDLLGAAPIKTVDCDTKPRSKKAKQAKAVDEDD